MDNFIIKFNEIKKYVPFEESWFNESGFIPNVVDINLGIGDEAKSEDPVFKRKLIFIGTRLGTVVFYQKYLGEYSNVYFSTWPDVLHEIRNSLGCDSSMSQNSLFGVLGIGQEPNIGQQIENLFHNWELIQAVSGI